MKTLSRILISAAVAVALIATGCPSPVGQIGDTDPLLTSTARVETGPSGGLVFVEEDGTETPVVAETSDGTDGPVELIDYVILDDGAGAGRSAGRMDGIRCIVIGRRHDGRSGVWVIYRHSGVVIVPNEDGIEDSALLELVAEEGSPWLGEGWVYEARAISGDGKIIIGQLSRPDGWKYLEGDVVEPEIGVWWTLYEKNGYLVVSRARPVILIHEPEPVSGAARHGGGYRYREWIERMIEWLQAFILSHAWNYLADAQSFVLADDVEGGIPAGQYVVAGPDKHGSDAWAWITWNSVLNIEDAPDGEEPPPPENRPPWPVTGPTDPQELAVGMSFMLELSDDQGTISDPSLFDPDGDEVTFTALLALPFEGPGDDPDIRISRDGTFTVGVWDGSIAGYYGYYRISVTDEEGLTTTSDTIITVYFY